MKGGRVPLSCGPRELPPPGHIHIYILVLLMYAAVMAQTHRAIWLSGHPPVVRACFQRLWPTRLPRAAHTARAQQARAGPRRNSMHGLYACVPPVAWGPTAVCVAACAGLLANTCRVSGKAFFKKSDSQ
eukprot:COSAG05_NODE_331_length_11273_cov_3.896635_4_plen_129_part_00